MLETEIKSTEEKTIIRDGFRRAWFVYFYCIGCISFSNLHWLTAPLIGLLLTGERHRILEFWPPLEEDTWINFFISYIFLGFGVCAMGNSLNLFDNIYCCTAQNLLSHLEVLKLRLHRLRLDPTGLTPSSQLYAIARYHDKILNTCRLLRNSSTLPLMSICINTVVLFCFGIFTISMEGKMDVQNMMKIFEISWLIGIQIYLICWYSNELTLQVLKATFSYYNFLKAVVTNDKVQKEL